MSADRAKQIKTTAVVNEDPTEKLIRELKEENEKLMNMLKAAQAGEVVTMKSENDDDDDDDDDDENSKKMSEEGIITRQLLLIVKKETAFLSRRKLINSTGKNRHS